MQISLISVMRVLFLTSVVRSLRCITTINRSGVTRGLVNTSFRKFHSNVFIGIVIKFVVWCKIAVDCQVR